jgi:hypothetical protein
MTSEENKRIATLTVGALTTTMESAKKAMLAAVEAAEEKTREMRAEAEEFIAHFEKVTSNLSNNVTSHVDSCQAAIEAFQAHHLKILNSEAEIKEPETAIKPVDPPHPPPAPRPSILDRERNLETLLATAARRPANGER